LAENLNFYLVSLVKTVEN